MAPNVDAVEYYLEHIWPVFRKLCPDAPTYIIGSRMPDRLRQMGVEHGVEMLGFVQDLTPYYDTCALSIAPLRYGAGSLVLKKMKLLRESLETHRE